MRVIYRMIEPSSLLAEYFIVRFRWVTPILSYFKNICTLFNPLSKYNEFPS